MTTSGTTDFSLTVRMVIEEAYERAGVEIRSGYEFRTALRTLNLLLIEWANRGLNLWTIDQEIVPCVIGTAQYTLPADTVDMIEAVIRLPYGTGSLNQTDISMERMTVSEYAQTPNKLQQGLPTRYYVQRLEDAPIVTLWLVPDQNYEIVYWRMRRMQDAGSGINTLDVPFRFIPAMVAGLAYWVAVKKRGAEQRVSTLKAQYDEAWQDAADEDRDRSSVFFIPDNPMSN